MTNLQSSIRAYRWHQQKEPASFAAEIGITTREYNRFEQGQEIDTAAFMKIMQWCLTDPDVKAIAENPQESLALENAG